MNGNLWYTRIKFNMTIHVQVVACIQGSIFVVFHSAADAKKFVEAADVKYGENDLIRYSK